MRIVILATGLFALTATTPNSVLAADEYISAQNSSQPNIVFLMTDDQNVRSLGCYGAPGVKTPNIDRLASKGVVFDRHYDTTAICMASRACVMTGLMEYRHGVNFNTGDGGKDGQMTTADWNNSYPMLLRQAGYRTAFAGKFGFVVNDDSRKGRLPTDDFDAWGGGPGQTSFKTKQNQSMSKYANEFPHATRSYGAFGRDFITQSAQGDRPFCLSISFKAPHRPVQPDPMFDDVYAGATFPKPKNFGREFGKHFSEQSRQGRQYTRFTEWDYDDNYDEVMAKYYQLIYAVDVAVGMITDALDDAGVAENTVVIFTSDNGYICGAHGYGSKVLPYEESSRVPLIMFDPRRKKLADRADSVTGNVDFAPTVLELAGVPIPERIDGQSLLPILYGEATRTGPLPLMNVWGPREVFSLSVVHGDWKYVYWPYEGGGMKPTAELYNLKSDRLELENVIGDAAIREAQSEIEATYDFVVKDWATNASSQGEYKQLATFFERK